MEESEAASEKKRTLEPDEIILVRKKAKVSTDNYVLAFTVKGECKDEVTFCFDDGAELYASKGFLMYMSPVFKRMFESDLLENQTGMVKLPGKDPNDVLMFLLASHPGDDRVKVRDWMTLPIMPLAEEYQVNIMKRKCAKVLVKELKRIRNPIPLENVPRILEIVKLMNIYSNSYQDVLREAMELLKLCNGNYLLEPNPALRGAMLQAIGPKQQDKVKLLKSCYKLFRELPTSVQQMILEARITAIDKDPLA